MATYEFHMSSRACLATLLLVSSGLGAHAEAPKPKPAFQYQSPGIEVPAATAEEPKMKAYGPESVRAAAKYLDDGAHAWTRERSCVACHTTGIYMLERPGLTPLLGRPSDEVYADFVKTIPDKLPEPKVTGGITHYPLADRSVWRSAGLAEWDKHVTGLLSEATARSLRDMLMRLSSHGGYLVPGEVEIPYVTTDFELTVQAARAITAAPGWLAKLKDPELLQRIDRMKTFLRESRPRNDYERALKLELATLMPELVPQAERDAAMAMLWQKQQADGGWSTRRMSDTHNWHTPMSEKVLTLIESQPDAANPGSDAYMTAFAIVLLRENGVPASDERLQRGIHWLKGEQRASGRWWMQSLYRGNYQFSTYIATVQAMKALALCGELPAKSVSLK